MQYGIETTPLINQLIAQGSPVAIGVSGGKDSSALALSLTRYLDEIGHTGPRVLIHSDLGRVEWRQSLPMCQRLAGFLGLELIVVKRQAGDLMDRWLVRWQNNIERYSNLECVKLILPWSTASMRFCTSELKTSIISRELIKRFPGQTILSAAGLRREESPSRAKAPVCAEQVKLTSKTHQTSGYNWLPILGWSKEDVFSYHDLCNFPLHEAYTKYHTTRVSCAFCILGSSGDLLASSACVENQDVYREMVSLEISSSFSFQSGKWLGDVASHLLSDEMRVGLEQAKQKAKAREAIEARIPKNLFYTKGWPHSMPTMPEALLLSDVRKQMIDVMQISLRYTEPDAILDRYAELISARPAQNEVTQSIYPRQQELWATA